MNGQPRDPGSGRQRRSPQQQWHQPHQQTERNVSWAQSGSRRSHHHSHRLRSRDETAEESSNSEDDNSADDAEIDAENESPVDGVCSIASSESYTLRTRQDAINTSHPFGIRIWKPAVYKKSRSVERDADADICSRPIRYVPVSVWVGNIAWSLTFGLALFCVCFPTSLILLCIGSVSPIFASYGHLVKNLSFYVLFPFGKYIELEIKDSYRHEDFGLGRTVADYLEWQNQGPDPRNRLFFAPTGHRRLSDNVRDENEAEIRTRTRLFGRGNWNAGRVVFYIWYYCFFGPIAFSIAVVCWFGVFSVPIARVLLHLLGHLRVHPLALKFRSAYHASEVADNQDQYSIILCTYRAFGLRYYKYTVGGTNVILLNMLVFVFCVIFDYFTFHLLSGGAQFFMCLLSIVPLAYFIGQGVASISAQSSMTMGATINAFFSTVVEIFLYLVALRDGKGKIVEGAIIGSIMAGVILLPGLSMCAGAIKLKTQRFNPRSTSVTATMLFVSIVGLFAPTLWYNLAAPKQLQCNEACSSSMEDATQCLCWMAMAPLLKNDFIYLEYIRPFVLGCVVCMFVAYLVGLWFTLRTHAAVIWSITLDEDEGGHDAPNWSRTKSYVILLSATLLYAIIAEILVDVVDVVLENVPISERLLGLTIFALVPNTTEFLNAISFSMQGNVSLSLEIGSAYALQVCLLQVPAVVVGSLLNFPPSEGNLSNTVFTMVFSMFDLWVGVICVLVYNQVHLEGKTNYFKGTALIITYIILFCGFYFDEKLTAFKSLQEYVKLR